MDLEVLYLKTLMHLVKLGICNVTMEVVFLAAPYAMEKSNAQKQKMKSKYEKEKYNKPSDRPDFSRVNLEQKTQYTVHH